MAPPLLVFAGSRPSTFHHREGLGGEGFVGLDDVHLVERQASLEGQGGKRGSDLRP